MPTVFLSHDLLQQWTDQGKAKLDDTVLSLTALDRTATLKPAVRFTALIDGSDEVHRLLGKVKTTAQLGELGAEHYMDSVLLGDVAYTVVDGFLGDLSPGKRTTLASSGVGRLAPALTSSTPPASAGTPQSDAEVLSKLFLQTVRDK
jgi:hypothetical protein